MKRQAIALAMLAGCATTGGKLGAVGAVVFTASAVLAFDPCLDATLSTDAGTYGTHCGSNIASAVFLGLAGAAAATGIGFELARLAAADDPQPPSPPAPLLPPVAAAARTEHGLLSALGYAEARELVHLFLIDREIRLDERDAASHYERESDAWIFEWRGPAMRVTLSVDATQRVKATRCERSECSSIP